MKLILLGLVNLLTLVVVGIAIATGGSGILLYDALGSDFSPFFRGEIEYYIRVFAVCWLLAFLGNILGGKWGRMAGYVFATIVYVIAMPAPEGDLGDNLAAQALLSDLHSWLRRLFPFVYFVFESTYHSFFMAHNNSPMDGVSQEKN